MSASRRSFILTAAFGTAVPSLVKADSLIGLPGDPLTARGLFAASKWAEENYREHPAARLVFADGQATGWQEYHALSRPKPSTPKYGHDRAYAVAIEVSATDASGKRFVTSDARMVIEHEAKRMAAMRESATRREERSARWRRGWPPSTRRGSSPRRSQTTSSTCRSEGLP